MYHIFYPFICQWTFRLFPCLGHWKSASMNIRVCISFWNIVLCEYMPRSRIAGSYSNSLSFWGTSVLFSIVAVPIYNPTNSVRAFPLWHLLFVDFLMVVIKCEVAPHFSLICTSLIISNVFSFSPLSIILAADLS